MAVEFYGAVECEGEQKIGYDRSGHTGPTGESHSKNVIRL
jgi:hypothetical protein